MKCWECKSTITTAKIVHYYSSIEEKEASRDVCTDCASKLKFNSCNYVEVNKIRQRSLR